nr:kinesin light chain 1 isoform X2 [Hydra vulgaris]
MMSSLIAKKVKITMRSIFGIQPSTEMLFLREKELCKIHSYFINMQESKRSTLVMYGMSGVGKTQLARKYCELYHQCYKNIVWIDAAFGKIDTSIINIGQKIGFINRDLNGNYNDVEIIVEKIHNFFKNEMTLYIFDNVDDESVRNLEKYISKKLNSFTLVTSQWRKWSNNVNQMPIDVFSTEEAFAYVKKNIKENNDENIGKLIKELGCHPFAITQAIKYINMHAVLIESYLSRYKSKPLEILDMDNFPTEAETKSVIKAINLVIIKLEKSKKTVPLQILSCLSHCNSQNISKLFIMQISKHMKINEEYLIDEAIELLRSYSLLDRFDDEIYSMHDLTQLSCRYFQSKNLSTNTYLDIVESYFKLMLEETNYHAEYGNHFVYHFIHTFYINRKRMSKTFYDMASSIEKFLVNKGLNKEAIEILEGIKNYNAEIYGEKHKTTLKTKDSIACCLFNLKKYNEALEIYYSKEKVESEVLGISHVETLKTKSNIAVCLCQLKKYDEVLKIYGSVLDTASLNVNHPFTLTTMNNIAICLVEIGKYNEALEILNSVDKSQTDILGDNHPNAIATKNNIAHCLIHLGKFNEGLQILNSIMKSQIENFGTNHPSTIVTKRNIVNCLLCMEKYKEALELFYSIEKIENKLFGLNHSDAAGTKFLIELIESKIEQLGE